jgi:hypothetical protein
MNLNARTYELSNPINQVSTVEIRVTLGYFVGHRHFCGIV